MFKLDLEKADEPEIKLPTSTGSSKKQESSRKTSASASLTILKPLTVWITTHCGKIFKRWEYQTTLPASWETCMQVKKQQLEPDMEQWTGFQIGKGVHQGCIFSPCLFGYIQSTSYEMPGWMKHKLESRLPEEISITLDMQMIPSLWQKGRETKEPLDENERGQWKNWLKTPHLKNEDHGIWSHHFMANRWETTKTVTDFIFLGPKSLQMVTASDKIKTRLLLGRKLWQT